MVVFVDDYQVKEVSGELLVDLFLFFVFGYGLVQCQVDFVVFFDFMVGDFVYYFVEGGEVLLYGLVDQDVLVCQEEDLFFGFGFLKLLDDLEGGVGFVCVCGYDQQYVLLIFGDCFDGVVDGDVLVVVWFMVIVVCVEWLFDQGDGGWISQVFLLLEQGLQFGVFGKGVEGYFMFGW